VSQEVRKEEGRRGKEFTELQEHYSKLISKVKAKDSEVELLEEKVAQLQGQ
jgi:predicted RNase H-like nuclease (RuvC/YqgF family)